MKKIKLWTLLAGISILSQSCFTYGEFTQSQYQSITSSRCDERSSTMHLFFDQNTIPFSYEKVGIVEAQGRAFASYEEVLDYLQYQAWKNCGNALLAIRSGYMDRVQGSFFIDNYTEEVYESKHFEAIAIRVDKDDTFLNMYGYGEDMSFIDRVEKDLQIKKNQNAMEIAGSAAIGILTILDAVINAEND